MLFSCININKNFNNYIKYAKLILDFKVLLFPKNLTNIHGNFLCDSDVLLVKRQLHLFQALELPDRKFHIGFSLVLR